MTLCHFIDFIILMTIDFSEEHQQVLLTITLTCQSNGLCPLLLRNYKAIYYKATVTFNEKL